MKRIASVALVILIAFSLLIVHRTYTDQIIPLSAQPVHNVNTGLNYTTIQAAIDAPETLDGHTLRCDAGNYTKNVHVHKSLKIIGAGPTLTYRIPFEPNDTDYITASNVTIEGFTVQSVSGYFGVSVYKVDNCSISNNVFMGSGGGILLRSSNNNTVSGNEIDSLPGDGIQLTDSSQGNEIVSNNLNGNHYGIQVRNASNYNVIADNFVNSSTWEGIRLNWQGSNYATVAFNNITNNIICHNYDGIFLDSPSNNNLVSDNMASDNKNIGIRLLQANNTTVAHNTVISNSYRGISTESSYANTIDDNFLNNTSNAWDNGVNRWNTTKQTGPNIIGGPYMGGNYWSDNPNPVDINNDGIGDVPYNIPGGSNKDSLPLVTQLPIFIASFMTPEGEPYPFDDIITSNGTWRREFTNATHIVTQTPENATYTLTYDWNEHFETYQRIIILNPREIAEFEFYALDPSMCEPRIRPYIYGKETGANVTLSWEYSAVNETLSFHIETQPSNKRAYVTVMMDADLTAAPIFAVKSFHWEDSHGNNFTWNPDTWKQNGTNAVIFCWFGLDFFPSVQHKAGDPNAHPDVTLGLVCSSAANVSIGFAQIDEGKVLAGVRAMLDNDSLTPYFYTFNMALTSTKDGVLYQPEYLDPQYAVPPGYYVMWMTNPEGPYLEQCLPLKVSTNSSQGLDVYPMTIEDLKPYSFFVAAGFFYANSSYSDLIYNSASKTIAVKVHTMGNSDWWGCFVLPNDRMVGTLTAYSGNASYQLRKLYNYTEQTVGNYTIITVRIPPEIEHLALNYTILGDVDGNGRVDMGDISSLCDGFGSTIGTDGNYWHHPACILCPHSPNLDIDCNGKIDMGDIVTGLDHFGQHYP